MRFVGSSLEKFWIGTVSFILFSTLLAMVLSIRGLNAGTAVLALGVGALATAFTVWRVRLGRETMLPADSWQWRAAAWIAFLLFAARAFLWLLFEKGDQYAVLSKNNLGDLPLHIQYIRFFSHGAQLWPVNPIHAHSTIGYPFGVDYFNALLDVCGAPIVNALIVTGLVCSLAAAAALYRWGRAFGMAGFLFNGGAVGLAIFTTSQWLDYQQEVDWKSIPLALFVTQRGFLYALPAGLLLLTQWRQRQMEETPSGRGLPFWLEWLIYATMPLFHLHTFLFLSVVLGALALFEKERRRPFCLGAAAFLPATCLVYLLTDGFHAGSHLGWMPGWMQGETFSVTYWLRNFGMLPFFMGWLLVVLVKGRAGNALVFVGPAVLVFVATLFVKFSPWEWDNTKLMMWSYLLILPFLWKVLVEKTPPSVRVFSCLLLFVSGFVSLCAGLGPTEKGYDIAKKAHVLSVTQAVKEIPVTEVFAAAPGHAHPLVFTGRRLALAYHGHMTGHGIPYGKEKDAMDRLMNGADDWQSAAKELGVRYIYWGEEEEKTWPASEKPWVSAAELVATETWGEIYKLP
ncbi:MAG TPA: hypothetical protein VF585_11320 [Chthoniobacterales bacterium]|jgi:hypothetical protein